MAEIPFVGGVIGWWSEGRSDRLEDQLKTWMISWGRGHHDGKLYWIIKDRFGRTFKSEFIDMSWDCDGTSLQSYHYDLVY